MLNGHNFKPIMAFAAMLAMAGMNPAQAQDRFEANTRGYTGGYSTFGGYYDTFGGYGGQNNYGYRRFNGTYSSTATVFAVPLLDATSSPETCGWLRQRASSTGTRKWKARYAACLRGN